MLDLQDRLDELQELGLYRRMRMVSGPQGPRVVLDGKPVLLLCSDNHLGLADHPRVREAAADAALRWGAGAGASRLVSGTMTLHRRLEERLADLLGHEAALWCPTGSLANVLGVRLLVEPGRELLCDSLAHVIRAELGAHATSLSHDPFTNKVYASLSTLEVVLVDAFTGAIEGFEMMPDKGRVAVSPSGKLYFMPADYFAPGDIFAWDLPTSL